VYSGNILSGNSRHS